MDKTQGKYVDGYLIPIPSRNLNAYKKMAQLGKRLWMEHGALSYYECVGEDLQGPWGISFPKLCRLKKNESVIFAFVVFKNKRHRDQVNAKVHADPRMLKAMERMKMPFDAKRFSTGGFTVLTSATD